MDTQSCKKLTCNLTASCKCACLTVIMFNPCNPQRVCKTPKSSVSDSKVHDSTVRRFARRKSLLWFASEQTTKICELKCSYCAAPCLGKTNTGYQHKQLRQRWSCASMSPANPREQEHELNERPKFPHNHVTEWCVYSFMSSVRLNAQKLMANG